MRADRLVSSGHALPSAAIHGNHRDLEWRGMVERDNTTIILGSHEE